MADEMERLESYLRNINSYTSKIDCYGLYDATQKFCESVRKLTASNNIILSKSIDALAALSSVADSQNGSLEGNINTAEQAFNLLQSDIQKLYEGMPHSKQIKQYARQINYSLRNMAEMETRASW
jgi:hypothetical protein